VLGTVEVLRILRLGRLAAAAKLHRGGHEATDGQETQLTAADTVLNLHGSRLLYERIASTV
jgi:hypothetical protein